MPGRNPLLIAKEYTRDAEVPQVRKNAVTALAALDDPEAWKALMEIAVEDRDAEVRAHAEAKIASLPSESAGVALQAVLDRLRSTSQQPIAYALLGRLRNNGLPFKLPKLPALTRLALAKSLSDQLYPIKGAKFRVRVWKGVLVGAGLLCLDVVLLVGSSFLGTTYDPSDIFEYFAVTLLLTFLAAAIATAFSTPACLQADAPAAAVLDIAMGVVAAWLIGVPVVLANLNLPGAAAALLAAFAITAVAVRLGTLTAVGMLASRRTNWALATLLGGGCGLAAYTFSLLLTNTAKLALLPTAWGFVVPAAYGLAASYASIDSQSAAHPRKWGSGLVMAALLTCVAALLTAVAARPLPPTALQVIPIQVAYLKDQSVSIKRLPVAITFTTVTDLECSQSPSFAGKRFKDGQPFNFNSYQYSKFPQGSYWMEIDQIGSRPRLFDALPEFAGSLTVDDLRARIFRRQPADVREQAKFQMSCVFTATFGAPKTKPPNPVLPPHHKK